MCLASGARRLLVRDGWLQPPHAFGRRGENLGGSDPDAEAARAEHLLIRDSQNLLNIANTYISVLEQSRVGKSAQRGMISTDIQSLRQSQDGLEWKLGLADFVEVCPRITGNRWRLPNCDVDAGMVRLHNEQKYSSTAKLARL